MRKKSGFTLAELLIALAILGVIAVFTIPKVLQSQQDGRWKATAKEAAGTIAASYSAYQQNNTVTGSTNSQQIITNYLNYVSLYTGIMDDDAGGAGYDCSITASRTCFRLHNGGVLLGHTGTFNNTATTNAVNFYFDPDGSFGGALAVKFYLYLNGRIATSDGIAPNTCGSTGCFNPNPALVPAWFSWN